ncbi:MAG: hypothetical protein Q8L86_10115 [Vicinamibacterales bacterium]|nr:hypothetical protein [Vicinamibacterales bacterium]
MIDDVQDRAEFGARANRGGRPRSATPTVPTCVRLPRDLFDAACRVSQRARQPLPEVIRQALRDHLSRRRLG